MRALLLACAVTATVLALSAAASAEPPALSAWDGTNPFVCQLQDAGTGTAVPDPGADPYCVNFDKRHQNVDQLGVVDFLSKEPARVASASPKCFYFQSDHWRGSIVQSNQQTKTYEWDGHYFFDKARGTGGVWVTNFNFGGHTADPGQIPGLPPEYAPYMGPGTGGVILHNDVPLDPQCAARATATPGAIYSGQSASRGGSGGENGRSSACVQARGRLTRRALGPVHLGDSEAKVRAKLGSPADVRGGFLRYCMARGARLLVGEVGSAAGSIGPSARDRAAIAITTSSAYAQRGIAVGAPARLLARRFRSARALGTAQLGRVWLLGAKSTTIAGVRAGRVSFLAVFDPSALHGRRALLGLLRRAG